MQHTLTLNWTGNNGSSIAGEATITSGDAEINGDFTIAASATDTQVAITIDTSQLKLLYITCDKDVTIEANAASPVAARNEVQTVTISGSPTGGTFTLTYSGQTTSAIAYNAAASAVEDALEALSNIGIGDVSVEGSAGGPYTVTFRETLGEQDVALMTASGASLTGGSSPAVAVAVGTAGDLGDPTFTITANKPYVWYYGSGITNPVGKDITTLYVTRTGGGAGTGDATLKIRTLQDLTL